MDSIKVISLNVRGLRDPTKRNKIFSYVKKFKSDIIMLQETHVFKKTTMSYGRKIGVGEIFI